MIRSLVIKIRHSFKFVFIYSYFSSNKLLSFEYVLICRLFFNLKYKAFTL
jgi:hypothetical protein